MKKAMITAVLATVLAGSAGPSLAQGAGSDAGLKAAVQADYDANLASLFDHFHRNPELSGLEVQT
ncbi:hypothetical protein ACP6NE_31965, partial [Pseudomonas aeruginosa]